VKLIGKLQDGNVSFKKGYNDGEAELFEFKTNEGNMNFLNVSPSL
jgi:hypothetical protein